MVADAPLNAPSKAIIDSVVCTRLFIREVFIERLSTEGFFRSVYCWTSLSIRRTPVLRMMNVNPFLKVVVSFAGKCLTGVVCSLSAEYEQRISVPFDNVSECRAE